MAFGLVDQPGAEELEQFADYLVAGWKICTEDTCNDEGEAIYVQIDEEELDAEIAQRISEYLRHGGT